MRPGAVDAGAEMADMMIKRWSYQKVVVMVTDVDESGKIALLSAQQPQVSAGIKCHSDWTKTRPTFKSRLPPGRGIVPRPRMDQEWITRSLGATDSPNTRQPRRVVDNYLRATATYTMTNMAPARAPSMCSLGPQGACGALPQ